MTRALTALGVGAVVLIALSAISAPSAAPYPPYCDAQVVSQMISNWRDELDSRAVADPKRPFPNLSRAELLARLQTAGARDGFEVVVVKMFHPLKNAPLIVTRWPARKDGGKAALKSLAALDDVLHNGVWWAYEGWFVTALDSSNVPFFASYKNKRRSSNGAACASDPAAHPAVYHIGSYPFSPSEPNDPGYGSRVDRPLCGSKLHPSKISTTGSPCDPR